MRLDGNCAARGYHNGNLLPGGDIWERNGDGDELPMIPNLDPIVVLCGLKPAPEPSRAVLGILPAQEKGSRYHWSAVRYLSSMVHLRNSRTTMICALCGHIARAPESRKWAVAHATEPLHHRKGAPLVVRTNGNIHTHEYGRWRSSGISIPAKGRT